MFTPSIATIQTSLGEIHVDLFARQAPKTVANFADLADGSREYTEKNAKGETSGPFYDGSVFHRVVDSFRIEGGDPTGTGKGGPGYRFADEFHPELHFDRPYLLAMANSGPDTNGSQFFITVAPASWLSMKHTIFGEVTREGSRQVVNSIATTPVGAGDRPITDVVIESIRTH